MASLITTSSLPIPTAILSKFLTVASLDQIYGSATRGNIPLINEPSDQTCGSTNCDKPLRRNYGLMTWPSHPFEA